MTSFSKREYIYGSLTIKEIARRMKKDLMREFPFIKFSVRSKPLQNKITVRLVEIDRRYLKSPYSFIKSSESSFYYTEKEIRRISRKFEYPDFYLTGSLEDDVINKIEQIYDEYNYFNNDEDRGVYDQRYYGSIIIDRSCKIKG